MNPFRPLARFAIECSAWFGPAGLFLVAYSRHIEIGAATWAAHFAVLAVCAGLLVSLRMAAWRMLPRKLARCAASLLLGGALSLLLLYYALVMAGLQSWGRVVSWTLIESYARQAPSLAEALGIAPAAVLALLALLLLVGCLLTHHAVTRHDWALAIVGPMHPLSAAIVVVASIATGALLLHKYSLFPPANVREPFSMTLYPQLASDRLQHHATVRVAGLEAEAEADRRSYVPNPAARKRNVILIVADALRADRLGLYGYERDTTPFLGSLEREGRLQKAQRMVATCAESACGLLALARSKYLHQFSDRDISLHEVLRLHGYWVQMILGGDHTNFYGLRNAYRHVDSYVDGAATDTFYSNDDRFVLQRVADLPRWDGKPVMLQLHLMSAHALGKRDPALTRFTPSAPYVTLGLDPAASVTKDASADNYYDNGVFQIDQLISRILAELKRKDYLNDSIVVLTSDHGESLGEHGEFGHAKSAREPALRIPFVTAQFGNRIDELVDPSIVASQVDIAPTVLAALDMPQPRTWAGIALHGTVRRAYIHYRQGAEIGLYDTTNANELLKYSRRLSSGTEEAFDVLRDPGERDDILPQVDQRRRRQWEAAVLPAAAAVIER